ncbi:MAG: carbohydrate ABC transporter permease [Firmicutes bacterium]|nr:carbohydrate ABC transporter permease [Bacillota bacterium]
MQRKRVLLHSKKRRAILGKIIVYFLLVVGAIVFLVPFIWMLSTSVKPPEEVYIFPPKWIPSRFVWENYVKIFELMPTGRFLLNSLVISCLTMAGSVISCSLVGFAFARLRFRGSGILFFILLITMMLPHQVTMVPLYMIFSKLGWVGTYFPLIVPAFFGNPYFIFLLRQFFTTIPKELDEAAKVDGCSIPGIFARIIVPMSKPALGIVAILSFTDAWNDFMGPLIYLSEFTKFPISLGLRAFQTLRVVQWELLMATSAIALIPVLVLFFLAQKNYIQGIVISGVKG